MNAELISGLVIAILSASLLLGVFLNYLDNRKKRKRIHEERKRGKG